MEITDNRREQFVFPWFCLQQNLHVLTVYRTMLRHFETFSVSESWTKELGPGLADSSLFFLGFSGLQLPPAYQTFLYQSQPLTKEKANKTVIKGLQHAATLLTSYALYSLFTCTTLCKIHSFFLDYRTIFAPLPGLSVTGRHIFVFIVVLDNLQHYASEATLNERDEIPSWARWVSNRIGHSSACHWYQRAASFPV